MSLKTVYVSFDILNEKYISPEHLAEMACAFEKI